MFINPYLLSEPRLYMWLVQKLPKLFTKHEYVELNEIKKIAYASWHIRYPQYGDQLFNAHWLQLEKRRTEQGSLTRALLSQVARYHFEDTSILLAIKLKRFDEWQAWISNQSGLPVIAYKAEQHTQGINSIIERYNWLESKLGYRCLVSPFHPSVEDYIEQNGLNETHIHLNGTSSLESMWHFALSNPQQITNDLQNEFSSERVQLLYCCCPELDTPKKYEELLYIARYVRRLLIAWVKHDANLSDFKQAVVDLLRRDYRSLDSLGWVLEEQQFNCRWTHLAEIELHLSIQRELKESKDSCLDYCYLLYILCMNNFQRLMVQRDDQFGFEQFQKFADNGVRESYEKNYLQRFYQLHGPNLQGRPDLHILEGRFAPKKSLEKNEILIGSILRGFIAYAKGEENCTQLDINSDLNDLASKVIKYRRPSLKLIAHYIKRPSYPKKEWHFETLRQNLANTCEQLFDLLNKYPLLQSLITGIDAAANELETPPEVFAPLYRKCRYYGLSHATYHVGEDFEHLLSGIRAVYEAIIFLDLKAGDRLGHATSIGIDPEYWLRLMPEQFFLPQGQHLENLLFLRLIALNELNSKLSLARIEARISEVASNIFGPENVSLNILGQFFIYRELEPEVVRIIQENKKSFTYHFGLQHEEFKRVQNVDISVQNLLYRRWFDQDVLKKYNERIEVPLSMFSYQELLEAQQYTQKLVAEKHIVLETLPTSNVRISHYNSIKDHHVFRWLRVQGRTINGDYPMLVTLGSDDPGIFATDMRNEFYHIFGSLVEHFKYSVDEALELTAKLNDNGRIYHFKQSNICSRNGHQPLAEI